MIFKNMSLDTLDVDMLIELNHIQKIKQKYIKIENEWLVIETNEIRQWDIEKRKWLPKYIHQQIERGGFTICAYDNETLVGFCCVDGFLYGQKAKYMNLTLLFVDDNFQRKGIGKKLFFTLCDIALQKGAEKIFISAIPSVQTISFYQSMGCIDAKEIIKEYIDTENDRYLEYSLK